MPIGAERAGGPSRPASVVLDIGPHAGALVVHTPDHLDGAEIEIRPLPGPWTGAHTAVRARHLGTGVVYAGLFDSLPPGRYQLRPAGDPRPEVELTVVVAAGRVTQTRFTAGDGPHPPGPDPKGDATRQNGREEVSPGPKLR